jgi:hypothetical protein
MATAPVVTVVALHVKKKYAEMALLNSMILMVMANQERVNRVSNAMTATQAMEMDVRKTVRWNSAEMALCKRLQHLKKVQRKTAQSLRVKNATMETKKTVTVVAPHAAKSAVVTANWMQGRNATTATMLMKTVVIRNV